MTNDPTLFVWNADRRVWTNGVLSLTEAQRLRVARVSPGHNRWIA